MLSSGWPGRLPGWTYCLESRKARAAWTTEWSFVQRAWALEAWACVGGPG